MYVYVYGGRGVITCPWLHGSDVKRCADVHDDARRRLNVYVCMHVYMCVHHGACVYVFVRGCVCLREGERRGKRCGMTAKLRVGGL